MPFEWLRRKEQTDKPDKKVEKIRARRDKIVEELHNPKMEEYSNKFFDASVGMTGLAVYEGGADGPYKEEYAKLREEYDHLLQEHEKDLFLYSTKKSALMAKNKMIWVHSNHWRYIFMRPKYIGAYAKDLGVEEKIFLVQEITDRLKKNLKNITKDTRLRESIPGFRRQGWEEKKWIDETQSDTESLQAFLPFLVPKEQEQANRLIAQSNKLLPVFIVTP